jgi:uroporphyrinogen-III synthase
MKLLVTRPAADSAALAALLEALGHTVVIDPMLEVRPVEGQVPALEGITGLLFTSANGARAFAALSDRRDIAVFAVGDRTAEAARQAGFGTVESADGDVDTLARLVRERRRPEDGALLHVSGTVRAGNLAETLGAEGYTVRHAALYEAVAATALGALARDAIADASLDGVLLFSPRTAKQFVSLVQSAGLADQAARLQAWCLSRAVADALAGLPLATIHIAATPTQASLLAALEPAEEASAAESPAPEDPVLETPAPDASEMPALEPPASAVPPPVAAAPAPGGNPPRAPARSAGRRGGRSVLGVASLVLLAIAAAATAPQWLPLLEPLWQRSAEPQVVSEPKPEPVAATRPAPEPVEAPPQPVPPEFLQRLARVEAALGAIRIDTDSTAARGDLTALQARMDTLARAVEALTARPVTDPQAVQDLTAETRRLAAAVAQLNDRLTPLEARVNMKAAAIRNDRTLVLAVGQIQTALTGAGPFEAAVAVIRAVAPDDADLDGPIGVLARHAKTGVASRVALARDMAALPARLAEPAPLAPDAGIWDRLTDRMSRIVTIRRVDDGSAALPPGPDRAIAQAEQALASGDLAGAVATMRSIDGPPAVRPWLDAAQARLDCEAAAEAIAAAATKRLSASDTGGAAE